MKVYKPVSIFRDLVNLGQDATVAHEYACIIGPILLVLVVSHTETMEDLLGDPPRISRNSSNRKNRSYGLESVVVRRYILAKEHSEIDKTRHWRETF